jgi:hypothetical protein
MKGKSYRSWKSFGASLHFGNPHPNNPSAQEDAFALRTERDGIVTGRAKLVRPEFVERVKQSTHWQHQALVPNLLAEGADIWS